MSEEAPPRGEAIQCSNTVDKAACMVILHIQMVDPEATSWRPFTRARRHPALCAMSGPEAAAAMGQNALGRLRDACGTVAARHLRRTAPAGETATASLAGEKELGSGLKLSLENYAQRRIIWGHIFFH